MQEDQLQQILVTQGWMRVTTLIHQAEENAPMVAQAFKALNEPAWSEFVENLRDNPALQFYNEDDGRFSHATSWLALAAQEGIPTGVTSIVKVTKKQMIPTAMGWGSKDLTLDCFSISAELLRYAEEVYYDDGSGFLWQLKGKTKQG